MITNKAWPTSVGLAILVVTLGGCASSSNVHQMSSGVFTVTATGDGFTTADRVQDLAYEKAETYCRKEGKGPQMINQQLANTRMGIDTTLALQFRCV